MAAPIIPSGRAKKTPLDSSDLQAVKDAITSDAENRYMDSLFALTPKVVSKDEKRSQVTHHILEQSGPREVSEGEWITTTAVVSLSGTVFFPFREDPKPRMAEDVEENCNYLFGAAKIDTSLCDDFDLSATVESAVPAGDQNMDVVILVKLSCKNFISEADLAAERDEARHPEEV